MEDATSVHIEPNADVDGIAGLTHKHAITLDRIRDQFPTPPFRVIPKPARNGENIFGIWNTRQPPTEVLFLDMTHEGPAVIIVRPFPVW